MKKSEVLITGSLTLFALSFLLGILLQSAARFVSVPCVLGGGVLLLLTIRNLRRDRENERKTVSDSIERIGMLLEKLNRCCDSFPDRAELKQLSEELSNGLCEVIGKQTAEIHTAAEQQYAKTTELLSHCESYPDRAELKQLCEKLSNRLCEVTEKQAAGICTATEQQCTKITGLLSETNTWQSTAADDRDMFLSCLKTASLQLEDMKDTFNASNDETTRKCNELRKSIVALSEELEKSVTSAVDDLKKAILEHQQTFDACHRELYELSKEDVQVIGEILHGK